MDIKFANYGQRREINATDGELEIFELLRDVSGLDLELVRMSDNYVTAKAGVCDFARFKFTPRAKWILFPLMELGSTKHRIGSPQEIKGFTDLISGSIEAVRKYFE